MGWGPVESTLSVVTGATGLLGSHLVEALVARGGRVRAVVRASSDVSWLQPLGAEVVTANFDDPTSLRRAIAGAEVVYHTAAHVGDWGHWGQYRKATIEATANLLNACHAEGTRRLLHVSSITVYGHPPTTLASISEDAPLGQRLSRTGDSYARSKIAAEEVVRAGGSLVTIVRPSWIIGPRDRNSLPRLLAATRGGWVSLVGRGDNLLNLVYAGDVADGAILAATHPGAAGRAYNLTSDGELTQREFFTTLAAAVGRRPVRRWYPFWLAHLGGLLGEVIGRGIGMKRSPYITRYSVGLLARSTRYSAARAREELDWKPRVGAREGLRLALEWDRHRNSCRLDSTTPSGPPDFR